MKRNEWASLLGLILVCVVGLQVYMLIGTASNYDEEHPSHAARVKSLRALNATLTRLKANLEVQIAAKEREHAQRGKKRNVGGDVANVFVPLPLHLYSARFVGSGARVPKHKADGALKGGALDLTPRREGLDILESWRRGWELCYDLGSKARLR